MPVVYVMAAAEAAKMPTEYCQRHFPKRYERACRYRFVNDRLLCIAAGTLLATVLACREEDIVFNAWGKPILTGTAFSLSHSGDYAILGVGKGKSIGVDIEKIGGYSPAVAKRMFLPDELTYMGDDNVRFYLLWTLKEAVMKAVGKGFSLPPSSFSVMPLMKKSPLTVDGLTLYADSVSFLNYRIAVCTTEPFTEIPLKIVEADGKWQKEISQSS